MGVLGLAVVVAIQEVAEFVVITNAFRARRDLGGPTTTTPAMPDRTGSAPDGIAMCSVRSR